MSNIFIGHSHKDAALAAEFQKFIDKISSKRLTIQRSSMKGSIEYGESWIDWIHERVAESEITFVLLTPSSFSAKWVLWEAGAVHGVKRAAKDAGNEVQRRVIPVRFRIPRELDLGPFQGEQVADGLDQETMVALAKQLLTDLRNKGIEGNLVDDALTELTTTCHDFVGDAESALDQLQVGQRDDLVLEWVARIDKSLAAKEFAITHSYRRWINIAFLGTSEAATTVPIDFRIHTRLAAGFQNLKAWDDARQQLLAAKTLSPRDMMILRELGRVELECGNTAASSEVLSEMLKLDPDILSEDEESLNLKVRILIESDDWPSAHELLREATELAKRSPYVANMRAIATMKVKGAVEAETYFKQLRKVEQELSSGSVWTFGNLVNAALGLGDIARADLLLRRLATHATASTNKDSISRYFDDIIAMRKEHDSDFDYDWKASWS